MNGIKQFVGRKILVTLTDGGAIQGTLWRVHRTGIEIRDAHDPLRGDGGTDISGIVWLPAHSVFQAQVTGGDN